MVKEKKRSDGALNILNQQLANISTENQYVTFQIGDENYGIDIMLVQEIIRYNQPTRVFNANPVIRGVINFRGKIIPVIDMHRKFNLDAQKCDEYTVVIIIEVNDKTMGMVVDRVSDIMSFNGEDIQVVDREFADDIKTEHIKGMAKVDNMIVMLLDPDRVLSFEELKQLENVKEMEERLIAEGAGSLVK